jgi:hypothetical protein
MSVFLRWGVFGILGVAALLYAYNASKRLAEVHAGKPKVAAVESANPSTDEPREEPGEPAAAVPPPAEPAQEVPAQCEAELVIAQRAIALKQAGEPLDRVLRMQEIAWEETPARRERLEKVATRWYGYEGSFQPGALRMAVINDCRQSAPAP